MFDKGSTKEPDLKETVTHLATAVTLISEVMQELCKEVDSLKEDVSKIIENNC